MLALRWHARRDVRVDDVDEPVAGPGTVLLSVTYCGICGTDVHEFADGPNLISVQPHPLTSASAPLTLGHEVIGVVLEVGPGVVGLQPGQRVVVEPCLRCGACEACRGGDHHHCARMAGIGLSADGGFAQRMVVPAYTVFVVPDGVPDDVAALAEPLAVALRAVQRGRLGPGSRVCINGFGPIGAACALWARQLGAARIDVVEPSAARRLAAADFEVDDVLDGNERSLESLGRSAARPELVIDCSGVASVLPHALRAVAPGGSVVWMGVGDASCEITPSRITAGERTVVGALGHGPFTQVLRTLESGRLPAHKLLSGVARLAEGPTVLDALTTSSSALKVLIAP